MHIVLDARLILPHMTGVGRYLFGLAEGFNALLDEGLSSDHFEFWVQAGLPPGHPAWRLAEAGRSEAGRSEAGRSGAGRVAVPGPEAGIQVRSLDLAHMAPRAQWVLPRQLARVHPDLFHYPHFDLPVAVPGPVVATLHDLKYLTQPVFFPRMGQAKRLIMKSMMAFTVRRARRVIAVSEYTRQDILHRLGATSAKVTVIPEGVDSAFFHTLDEEAILAARQRYGLPGSFLLCVGERRPHKNLVGLLEAFAVFSRLAPRPYQLAIAGKAYAGYQEPERTVEALGLAGAVHFLDYVAEADLPLLYRAADAFVLLSFYEGFGLPVLEAMASGVPVVAANTTSLPEVAGEAALLVPPDDPDAAAAALLQVIPGGSDREACLAAGLNRAQRFTWRSCAQQTLSIYREAA